MNRSNTSIKLGGLARRGSARRKGFTLIELMVVILILAILAALIVPRVLGRQGEAKTAAAKSDEATLSTALASFRLACDRYPTSEEGLNALQQMPAGLDGKWKGPYLTKDLPADPWGNAYNYQSPGTKGTTDSFTIKSFGSDGQEGGTGEAEDVVDDE